MLVIALWFVAYILIAALCVYLAFWGIDWLARLLAAPPKVVQLAKAVAVILAIIFVVVMDWPLLMAFIGRMPSPPQ